MSRDEIAVVQAEVLAIQAVLMAVFRRLAEQTPELSHLFCAAFDEAEARMTGVATRLGMESALGTTTEALTIIDELRRAVIRDERSCG
jgi:hypothetical protein